MVGKNNPARSATESRPIRGAKNRIQTSSSASADFLLEKDLRGTPPKSEKRQLLARRGSGAGGAALLRKEKGEFNIDCHDSAIAESRNDEKKLDSQSKQNQKIKPALDIFYKIAQIPHPSGYTKDLQKFIIDFLRECDCKVESDSAGNIHALKGAPKLVFQAHYDMVLVGQKVAPFVENGFLKSRDSSLGADNGIAVALLLDFAQKCENVEILLTNDEEIGMLGAKNLTLQTQSKTMINLDSECLNEICVGCAGGFDADISLENFALPTRHCEDSARIRSNPIDFKNAEIYELSAQNFKGGHSGIDIDKNIKNAVVELLWTLESLRQKCEFSILEISGGENRNSIPINAKAVIMGNALDLSLRGRIADSPEAIQKIAQPNLARFVVQKIGIKDAVVPSADFLLESDKRGSPPKSEKRQLLARRGSGAGGAALLRKESSESNAKSVDCFGDESPRNDDIFLDSSRYALKNDEWEAKSAPHITITKLKSYTPNHTQNPLNSAVIPHLLRLHNGIYEKNGESITSSLNFSLLSNDSLKLLIRANSAEFLERHKTRLKALFGDSVKISGFYNAWDSSSDSPILGALQGLYDKHKIAHKVVQIHAGLECGILMEKCALREVVSIGPTIFHPHSKNEALDLDSFGKIYDILCDLMEL